LNPADPRPEPYGARSSPTRRRLRAAAVVVVVGFLAFALASGWSDVAEYDWRLDLAWLAAGIALLPVYHLVCALGFAAVVHALAPGVEVRRLSLVSLWAKSMLGRYVPGNVMMVAGRLELGADLGLPRRVSLAASVYEQTVVLGVSAIAGLGFLLQYGDLGKGVALWATALIPCLLVALHPRAFRRLSTFVLRRAGREPLTVFLSGRQLLLVIAWYALVIAVQGVAAWLLIRAAAGPPIGGPVFVGLAYALAFTVAMVAFVFPSGLGVRDGLFALALATRLPNPVAVAVSVGYRMVATVAEIAFALVAARLERRARGRANGVTPSLSPR
jgi:hypothetical protein